MPDPLDMSPGRLTTCADQILDFARTRPNGFSADDLIAALPKYTPSELVQAMDLLKRIGHRFDRKALKGGTEQK